MSRMYILTALLAGTLVTAALEGGAWAQSASDEPAPIGADPAQIARGAQAWAETCNGCHNLRDPKELNDEDWTVSVTHMRVRANIPGQMARDIAEFLKSSN